MPHDDIPNLLGRVLSGTKYGVRQTRGKFGLGAKMALIWVCALLECVVSCVSVARVGRVVCVCVSRFATRVPC